VSLSDIIFIFGEDLSLDAHISERVILCV